MAGKTIYLEYAFWDKFSECMTSLFADTERDPVEKMSRISQCNNLYSFIRRSNVFIDSPLSTLAEKAKEDPFLRSILKRNGDGEMVLEQSEDPFPDLKSNACFEFKDDFSAIYLTGEDFGKDARKHGVLNISPNTIWDQEDKFVDSGDAVQKNKAWVWKSMKILQENSNGMVIVDNFVLSPDYKTGKCSIGYDLRELFRNMLPPSCTEEYQISIFYHDNSDSDRIIEAQRNQFSQSIRDFIRGIRKDLVVNLELFPTSTTEQSRQKDFHDRTIITNNIWIGSEAGFDLLVPDYSQNTNTRALKSTKTHGLYFGFGEETARWLDKAHEQLLDDAKKCLQKYKYTTKNRLLQQD